MPARITVHLTPTDRRATPPPQTGPAVYAALLAALTDAGATDLAAAFHQPRSSGPDQPKQPKPFALTPLLDDHDQPATATSGQVHFDVGVLHEPATATVLDALGRTPTVRIARCTYRVATVTLAAASAYTDLLAGAQPATTWRLRLITPVGFATAREEGPRRMRPLPEPERVLASLATRWQALAGGVPLPAGLPAAIAGHLELVDFQLTMAEHLVKAGQPARRGSIGQVTYRVVEPTGLSAPVRCGLDALLAFAAYAGIGDRTAVGMGQVRLLAAQEATATPQASDGVVDPAGYTNQVQSRPYGPHQVDAGPIQVLFHGPYAVLTLTDPDGTQLTIRASVDDSPVGADLAAALSAAAHGRPAILDHPDGLVCRHPLAAHTAGIPRPHIRHLTIVPGPTGSTLLLAVNDQHHALSLSTDQTRHLAAEVTAWATAG